MKRLPANTIQPTVLRWARETVGKSHNDVARALKRPIEEIEAWENGSAAPTYVQLEKLAYEVYKRPLAIFFLPEPPEESDPKKDFRTLPESDFDELLPDTYLHIRKARAYQAALLELFGDVNPNPNPIWQTVMLSEKSPVEKQASLVRSFLNISLETQQNWADEDSALKQWRSAVENAGIFVFKNSLKQKSISSFCLSDEKFPIIYINNSTTKTRQIFSIFHELAHIMLRINGISKTEEKYINELPQREQKIEKFCNKFAAELLIPAADFTKQAGQLPIVTESNVDETCRNLSKLYSVSREAILRRFLDDGKISPSCYKKKSTEWINQQKKGSGGNPYLNKRVYLSAAFSREVFSRYYKRQITKEEASDYLDIKSKQFDSLEAVMIPGN